MTTQGVGGLIMSGLGGAIGTTTATQGLGGGTPFTGGAGRREDWWMGA